MSGDTDEFGGGLNLDGQIDGSCGSGGGARAVV